MKDIAIAFVGAALISGLLMSNKDIIENWGGLPARSVSVEQVVQVEDKCRKGGEGAQQAMGVEGASVSSDFVLAPPSMQAALAPRFGNVGVAAAVSHNLPAQQAMGIPSNPLTYGGSKENYEDERYEPISQAARVPVAQQQAQAMADMGMIKARNQPNITVDTECGPASVTVYDRLVFANQKSRLYGQGDPIRGDIGCIVPIKDAWFRPSVRPNIDLRAGALSVMGGIDNDTPRELRALQNIYSAGISNIQNDAYVNQVSPAQAQKSTGISGAYGAQQDVVISAYP
jgi:hypothetical protein